MTGADDADDARDPAQADPALGTPDFDDPAFDEVRALLADARVTEPVPASVIARLDDTLASLRAERPGRAPADAVVVPLRRRFAPMIVAAAAVVVVAAGGVGISRLAQDGSGSSNSSADSAAGSASSLASTPPPESGAKSAAPSAGSVPAPQLAGEKALALPSIRSTEFAQDAAQVMRSLTADTAAQGQLDSSQGTQDTNGSLQAPPVTASPRRGSAYDTRAVAACTGPSIADTVVVPARLDGSLVALVFRAPTATAQQVEAWSCDGSTLVTSASVPR